MRRTAKQRRALLRMAYAGAEHMARQGFVAPFTLTYGKTRRGKEHTLLIYPAYQRCCLCGKNEGTIRIHPSWHGKRCEECGTRMPSNTFGAMRAGQALKQREGAEPHDLHVGGSVGSIARWIAENSHGILYAVRVSDG